MTLFAGIYRSEGPSLCQLPRDAGDLVQLLVDVGQAPGVTPVARPQIRQATEVLEDFQDRRLGGDPVLGHGLGCGACLRHGPTVNPGMYVRQPWTGQICREGATPLSAPPRWPTAPLADSAIPTLLMAPSLPLTIPLALDAVADTLPLHPALRPRVTTLAL